ncbi:SDR family NAD(P)-dependent oxidoreductase [Rhizobium sp. SG2393]|uniref:SDR family NAD(P)-dependent oxidoreductase n=1 Tax=Rhizobium sp. SG2393 TaxID=3276279 RepID=UPI00366F7C91
MGHAFIAKPDQGVAWVTGASSGIGRAVALGLLAHGFRVVVTARSHDKLVELQNASSDPGRIIVLDGDVTNPDDMKRVLASIEYEHGRVALAVLNAGIYIPVSGDDLKVEDFQKTFDVNLSGVVNGLVPLIAHMRQRQGGQIAIVSSVTGYRGLPTSAAYGATKAALINMAESLKFDLDHENIHLQIIDPGFVETAATASNAFTMPALVTAEEAAKRIVKGLGTGAFEITFPKRFTYVLKLLRIFPYALYFPLVARMTGWNKPKVERERAAARKS